MGRHGHDQPAFYHLQQPGAGRTPRTAKRRVPRSRIFSLLCQQRTADFRTGCTAMKNLSYVWLSGGLALCLIAGGAARAANGEAEFKVAYASAAAAEQEAGKLRNQWTVTEASLAEARTAAAKGEFE